MQYTKWLIGVAIVVVLGGGAYAYLHRATPSNTSSGTPTSTPEIRFDNNGVVTSGGTATVSEVPARTAPKAPDYHTPLSFPDSMDADARAAYQHKFDLTVSGLDQSPTSFGDWINLGMLRKAVGDYEGARVVWTYVTELYPSNQTAHDDLGDLYLNFIKDYPQAEANFKTAIRLDPHDINAYTQLFALYTSYGYKSGTTAAADLVAQGLKDNPGNQNLLDMQAQLK